MSRILSTALATLGAALLSPVAAAKDFGTIPQPYNWNPDLTITDISITKGCLPTDPEAAQPCNLNVYRLSITVANDGIFYASSKNYLDLFFNRINAPEVGDLSADYVSMPAIAAGDTWEYVEYMSAPPLTLHAIVDTIETIEETDETNNVAAW